VRLAGEPIPEGYEALCEEGKTLDPPTAVVYGARYRAFLFSSDCRETDVTDRALWASAAEAVARFNPHRPGELEHVTSGEAEISATYDSGDRAFVGKAKAAVSERPPLVPFLILPARVERLVSGSGAVLRMVTIGWEMQAGAATHEVIVYEDQGNCTDVREPELRLTVHSPSGSHVLAFDSDTAITVCVTAKTSDGQQRPASNNGQHVVVKLN